MNYKHEPQSTIDYIFSSEYLVAIYAALFFMGYLFDFSATFICFASILCALSLLYSTSLNALFSFLALAITSLTNAFEWNYLNILSICVSGFLILVALIYFLIKNRKTFFKHVNFGKLAGGLFLAFVCMFFVGIGSQSYSINGYLILAMAGIAILYFVGVNTNTNYILATIVSFALITNFEIVLSNGHLLWADGSALIINVIAICACFMLCDKTWVNTLFFNFLATIFVLFTLFYSASFICVIAVSISYIASSIYYVIKNPYKWGATLSSFCALLLMFVVAGFSTTFAFVDVIRENLLSINLSDNINALTNLGSSVAFGLGFGTNNVSSVIYVITSVGVVGSIFLIVFAIQTFKYSFNRITYLKVFTVLAMGIIISVSIITNVVNIAVIITCLSLLAATEIEYLPRATNPGKDDIAWSKTHQKYIDDEANSKTFYERYVKRLLDVVLSFAGLVVLSPLFLIIMILSTIILKGNPFFAQYRPGKNGKIFKLYKFRSMTNKTDENGNLLPDKDRLTKYGKILRKLSIDELPQLVNIFIGDMSIVGPRPRLIKDMLFYDEDVLKAYSVRPGLTGESQVSGGRSESSWEKIFECDKKYAERITLFGDIKILFKTVGVVFGSSDGSSGGIETSKRDYWYADYLLKTGKITKEQYNKGFSMEHQIIAEKGVVKFTKDLH